MIERDEIGNRGSERKRKEIREKERGSEREEERGLRERR